MKRVYTITIVVILLIIATSTVLAGADNAAYFDWEWQGNKSGYFQAASSGLVHFWSYDRPTDPPNIPYENVHFIAKPLDKFPGASCEEGAVLDQAWSPRGIYSLLDATEKPAFMEIFGSIPAPGLKPYWLCGYPIE